MPAPEIKIDTDSRVALDLFAMHLRSLSDHEKKALLKDTDKLLKTFANFVFAVKKCEVIAEIE